MLNQDCNAKFDQLVCYLEIGHEGQHRTSSGIYWASGPILCCEREGVWECCLKHEHKGRHQTVHGSSWLNKDIGVSEKDVKFEVPYPTYIECGHKNIFKPKFICTRVRGHKGPHENDHGTIWENEENKVYIEKEEVKEFSGVTSTKIPRFELIPFFTLCLFAGAFEEGIRKKNEGAWNALNAHLEDALKDKLFVVERLSHVIKHCYKAIGKVMEGKEWEGEEDAGAIMFGGSVLAEYKRLRREK